MRVKQSIEINNEFITSKPRHAPHPRNKPWEYFLFAMRVNTYRARIKGKLREWCTRSKYIHTLTGWRKRDVENALKKFVSRKDVKVIN